MAQVLLIIILLAAMVAGNILARHLTKVPLPFFLIAIGAVMAFMPYGHFQLDPETFTFAVIAPLLFNEAQNSSRLWIGRSLVTILSLAVGLVIVTVVVVGTGLHFLFPIIPLSLALALCAIVTPTDASAVNSIFAANPIAQEQMQILQNESLFNDAAGIVAFDVALTAYVSGSFSVNIAIETFLKEFLGGLAFGGLLGLVIVSTRLFLIRHHDDTALIMVTIQILTPFLVYALADQLGLSGILAVVAAGMVQGSESGRLRLTSARMQMVTKNVWEIISGILSGSVFLLLGLSLPEVLSSMRQRPALIGQLGLAAVFVYVAIFALRWLWGHFLVRTKSQKTRSWRDSLILALSGAHGTITLSLAFSIPRSNVWRGPLIFMAALIIFISLLLPTLLIPVILPAKDAPQQRYQWVRKMLNAAITALKPDLNTDPAEAQIVLDTLQQQLILDQTPNVRLQRRLIKACHRVEQKRVADMHAAGEITADEQKYYYKFLELNNFSADEKAWKNIWLRLRFSLHYGQMYKDFERVQEAFLTAPVALEEVYWRRQFEAHGEDILPIEQAGFKAIMAFLKTQEAQYPAEASNVRRFYQTRHRRVHIQTVNADRVYQLFMKAFHAEYTLIQEAVGTSEISRSLAEKLQQRITTDEMAYLQNVNIYKS